MPPGISICIRTAQYLDIYKVANVLNLSFYGYWPWLNPFLEFLVAADVQGRMFEDNGNYACLIAIIPPTQVIGSVEISLRQLQPGQVPYLFNLAVHPLWRRQGIGQKLLTSAEQQIILWNFGELYLHVLEENTPAQQLYLRSGYFCTQRENRLFRGARLLYRKQL